MSSIEEEDVLFGYEEELKKKTITDWLKGHTSFMKPLHRHEGKIRLTESELIIESKDIYERINKDVVTDINLGFDDVYRRRDDRSIGLTFQPLRVRYEKGQKEVTLYLIIGFSRLSRTSNNKEWYDKLQEWKK